MSNARLRPPAYRHADVEASGGVERSSFIAHGAGRRARPHRGWRRDGSDRSVAQRIAGAAFLIRVASAGIIYLTQVLLARWMGRFEFGIYVYVWAWVGFLGMLSPDRRRLFGAALHSRVPTRDDHDGLRGFLRGSRRLCLALGVGAGAALLAGAVWLLGEPHPGLLRRAVHAREPGARDLRGELDPGFDRARVRPHRSRARSRLRRPSAPHHGVDGGAVSPAFR